MFDDSTQDWTEVNQQYLMAALGRVRIALESHQEGTKLEKSVTAEVPVNPTSALETLCTVFGLSISADSEPGGPAFQGEAALVKGP